ncbi:MAG: hypothetical protein ACREYF_06080, partial [Gammaproteobacteria bacterium]
MTLLLVTAVSLFLLPRTEAAAQAPLVTIQTRVVGTGANPYSTQICTQDCNTPNPVLTVYPATGSGPGYHVVALNRATLSLVLNNTYGLDFNSLNSMNNDVTGLGNNVLVVISSIGPAASISSQAIDFLNNVAYYLGALGQGFLYGGTMSPSAYSLVGIAASQASGAIATYVSNYADPDTDGNISGALVLDVQSNYAFTYSTFVTIQTMTGPRNDTIMIGSTAFQAPPLAAGTPGGFHLLIVKRMTIDRIATDPTVVILHTSYSTNSSNPSTAASETHRMASDLSSYPNGLSTGNLLFIISSLGNNPGFNLGNSITDFLTILGVITQLSGAGNLDALGSNGYYSIIGVPNNSGDFTLSPEVRSYATPQLSGNITAVMQQTSFGLFTPVSSSAFPNAALDLSLYSTAYAAPSQWPVAASGSDAVCPTGDLQCAAYKWISWQIICQGNFLCTDEDVRGHYTDLNLSMSNPSSLAYPPQPTTQPAGFVFSELAFTQVQNQLALELGLVNDVRNFFTNNLTTQVVLASLLTNDL